jgi:hypothetical protein
VVTRSNRGSQTITIDFDVVYLGDCDLQVKVFGMRSGVRYKMSDKILSLRDILKLSKSLNNEILKYRSRNVDSDLTDISIVCPSVRLRHSPQIGHWRIIFFC